MSWRILVWMLQCLGFDPRSIFTYHNGTKYCHADPVVLTRKLWSVMVDHREPKSQPYLEPFDDQKAKTLIQSGNGEQIMRGYAIFADVAREVFDLPGFGDGGLTEIECERLVSRFQGYMGDLKKNGNGMRTSSPNTGSTAASGTNSGSASSSISGEKVYDLPDVPDLGPPSRATLSPSI